MMYRWSCRSGSLLSSLTKRVVSALPLLAFFAACSSKPAEAPRAEQSSGSRDERAEAADPLQITGLRGTLSQQEIRSALEPRLPKLGRCIQKRTGELPWLSGHMLLSFLVSTDGSVASVFPRESTVGDRTSESCALDIARATHFAQPHGGEAEFTWSFEMPIDDSVREPVSWSASDVPDALAQLTSDVASKCGAGPFAVTAYVETEGQVVGAGVATDALDKAQQLDCVAESVRAVTFPSPGSYAAKLTFQLP